MKRVPGSPRNAPPLSIVPIRHLRFGWWSLLIYLTLGIVLEALHGFKLGWYLDVGNETRRLMFTLAHAHGVLLGLINIAAGFSARSFTEIEITKAASFSLIWSGVLLPAGFFLGGIVIHGGDPGLGILLVPVGAFMLLFGVWSICRSFSKMGKTA